jgi:hypothetical protein
MLDVRIEAMGKYWGAFLSAVGMAGLTAIPGLVSPDHLAWLRWRIAMFSLLFIGLAGLIVQLYLQHEEEKRNKYEEQKWRKEQPVRDHKLIAAVIAEMREKQPASQTETASPIPEEEPKATKPAGEVLGGSFELKHNENDPRIYVDVIRAKDGNFPNELKSFFVLTNEGAHEATKVLIEPLEIANGKAVFEAVECISGHKEARILPETTEHFERHDITELLLKGWNDVGTIGGEIPTEFSCPMRITYHDFSGRRFETRFDLVLLPIKEIVFKQMNSRLESSKKTLFVRNTEVRPLP